MTRVIFFTLHDCLSWPGLAQKALDSEKLFATAFPIGIEAFLQFLCVSTHGRA